MLKEEDFEVVSTEDLKEIATEYMTGRYVILLDNLKNVNESRDDLLKQGYTDVEEYVTDTERINYQVIMREPN